MSNVSSNWVCTDGTTKSSTSTATATVAAAAIPIAVRKGMLTTASATRAMITVRPAKTTADPARPTDPGLPTAPAACSRA